MGGGLLQKVDRDTMSFATKLNYIIYKGDGVHRNVMKRPKTDGGKFSLPGILQVKRSADGLLHVHPREWDEKVDPADNALKVVYDHGPLGGAWEDFDTVRARVAREWAATPKLHNPISEPMNGKIRKWIKDFDVDYEVRKWQ
jgi:nicotinamide phosphoribosyltransferase